MCAGRHVALATVGLSGAVADRRRQPMQMSAAPVGSRSRNLVLAAMIFAVSMTFIDQTIVSIAVPQIQHELGLTSTGVQWAINAYLLSLAALFAFGGRLADTVGHRGWSCSASIVFAGASALCGLTPKGSARRGVDRDLPGRPGSRRGDHVPGRAGHRGARPSPCASGARRWPSSSASPAASRRSARSSAATSRSGRGGRSSGSTSPSRSSPWC